MRFLITAGSGPDGAKETGDKPFDENLFVAYMKFNEEMHKAGVLVASEGLNPSGGRARVVASGGKRKVSDGPFAESKELVGGFYLIDVKSKEEAIEWALRCPVGMREADVLEIYQLTEASDIPPELRKVITQAAPSWSAAFEGRR